MTNIVSFFKEYSESISRFFGLEIEIKPNDLQGIEVEFINLPKDLIEMDNSKLNNMATKTERVLLDFYERYNAMPYKPIYKQILIEEIAYEIIKNNSIKSQESLMDFIEILKDLCNKTYELEATQIGFIIIKDDKSNFQDTLKWSGIKFHPTKETQNLESFLKEKQTLKIVDAKSISIVINAEFKLLGIAQKLKEKQSIHHIMMNRFEVSETIDIKRFLYDYYVKSEEEAEQTSHLKSEYQLFGRFLEVKNMFDYVYMNQKNIFWSSSNESTLIFSNGQWKLQNHFLLRNLLCRHILLQNDKKMNTFQIELAREIIENSTKKVMVLYGFILNLARNHIGSLICILNGTNSSNTEELFRIMLRSQELTFNHYSMILKDNENHPISIEECDSFLFSLICSIDGAVILDLDFNILSAGEMINSENIKSETIYRGARTIATVAASTHGLAIKVSEDGDILIFEKEEEVVRI